MGIIKALYLRQNFLFGFFIMPWALVCKLWSDGVEKANNESQSLYRNYLSNNNQGIQRYKTVKRCLIEVKNSNS